MIDHRNPWSSSFHVFHWFHVYKDQSRFVLSKKNKTLKVVFVVSFARSGCSVECLGERHVFFFFAKLVWNEKTKQKQPDILETVEKMKLWFLMQSVLNSRFLPEVLADWVELGSQSQRGNTTWKNKILQKRPFQAGWKRCRVTDNPFGCNWWNKMFDNKVLHHCQYFTVIILYFGILPLLCTCNFGIPSLLAKIAWTCRCQALTKRWTLNIEWVRQKRWKTSDTSKTGKTHRIQRRNLRKLRKLVYVWRLGIFCEV